MSDNVLRDRDNRVIGRIETSSNGRQTIRDRDNRILGYYDPADNTTRDRDNHIIGRGNLLASLLRG